MFQSQSLLASDSNSDSNSNSNSNSNSDSNSYSNSSDLEGSSSSSNGGNTSRYKNDFREIAELGQGGYGKVYRCLNKLDGKEYAVKMIPFAKKMTERVLWEVKTIAKMSHSNIVRYYQAWIEKGVIGSPVISTDSDTFSQDDSSSQKDDRVLYIVLELCDGILERKPLFPQDSLGIFLKICDGVEHIHQNSIVHRDLSTKNIFFDDQVPKIGDFGLARFLPDEGKVYLSNNSGKGAIKYIAPETENDPCYASKQSDIYSLGVLLFELLYPMATTSEEARVLGNLKYKKLFPNDWKYESHNKMILNMIEEDPKSRPTVAMVKSYLLTVLENFYNKMPFTDAADQTDKDPRDIQYHVDFGDQTDKDPRDIQSHVDSADRTGKDPRDVQYPVNFADQTDKDPRDIQYPVNFADRTGKDPRDIQYPINFADQTDKDPRDIQYAVDSADRTEDLRKVKSF